MQNSAADYFSYVEQTIYWKYLLFYTYISFLDKFWYNNSFSLNMLIDIDMNNDFCHSGFTLSKDVSLTFILIVKFYLVKY